MIYLNVITTLIICFLSIEVFTEYILTEFKNYFY